MPIRLKLKLILRAALLRQPYIAEISKREEAAPVGRILGRSTQNRHRSARALFMNLSKQRTQKQPTIAGEIGEKHGSVFSIEQRY